MRLAEVRMGIVCDRPHKLHSLENAVIRGGGKVLLRATGIDGNAEKSSLQELNVLALDGSTLGIGGEDVVRGWLLEGVVTSPVQCVANRRDEESPWIVGYTDAEAAPVNVLAGLYFERPDQNLPASYGRVITTLGCMSRSPPSNF